MNIVVIGMSHTNCLRAAAMEAGDSTIQVIGVRNEAQMLRLIAKKRWNAPGDISILPEFLAKFDPNAIFISMVGGNYHNSISLVESDEKFDFVTPHMGLINDTARTSIPYNVMVDHAQVVMDMYLQQLAQLALHFRGRKFHLAAPPVASVPTGEFLPDDIFKGKTISHDLLRLKLYTLCAEIKKRHCEKLGVIYVDPPQDTIDERGLSKRKYWDSDPTHANKAYGDLLLRQIKELAE